MTAVSAQCTIPVPPVPFTLQVFAVLLTGGLLGSRDGAFSQLGYLLIGLIGAPVFAGFRGGPEAIVTPSFGYLLGFVPAAAVAGLFNYRTGLLKSPFPFILALFPIYLAGPAYLFFIAPLTIGKTLTIAQAFGIGVVPFIVPDIIKALLAWVICFRLSKIPNLCYRQSDRLKES